MIGLFALAVLVAWVKLTQWFWRFWRIRRKEMIKAKKDAIDASLIVFFDSAFTVGMLVWLSVFLWYTGGQRFYYDAKVKRLCAIDGGVKVYETMNLLVDGFDTRRGENALGPEYVYKNTNSYIRKGYPSIEKRHTQVYRRHDMGLIGEKITYSRGGGGVPRPFGFSAYRCPEEDTSLFEKLFIMQKGDF